MSTFQLAQRLDRFNEPQTIKMAKMSRALKAEGIDVIDLSLGEPDFITPQHIIQAAKDALDAGYTKYPPVAGIPELRQAVCHKLKRDNHLDYLPENIVVGTGAKQVLADLIMCLVNPGDEVIIPTPYWVSYSALVELAQGTCEFVRGTQEQEFKITPAQLENAITEKTKLFIFSSPCNPTGSVYSKDELKSLAEVFEKHPHVFIISDEIYEYINFVGDHASLAQFDSLKDRVAIVNGFSKGFAMTGWRLGYLAAPVWLAQACEKYQAQFTSGANSIAQRAGVVALNSDLKSTKDMVAAYKERKQAMYEALKEIPGIKINNPEAAFYLFPDVSSFYGKTFNGTTIKNSEDLSIYLLNHAHVTTVNGAAFGEDHCIRLSVATSLDKLLESAQRIKKALAELK